MWHNLKCRDGKCETYDLDMHLLIRASLTTLTRFFGRRVARPRLVLFLYFWLYIFCICRILNVSHFPPLQFCAAFSCLAISCPAFSAPPFNAVLFGESFLAAVDDRDMLSLYRSVYNFAFHHHHQNF